MALTEGSTKRRADSTGEAIKVVTATGESALIQVVALSDADGDPAGVADNPLLVDSQGLPPASVVLETLGPVTGNYSAEVEVFEVSPPTGEVWDVTSIAVLVEDAAAHGAGTYGNLAELTNGVTVQVSPGPVVLAGPVQTNAEWAQAGDRFQTIGDGSAYVVHLDFGAAGIRLTSDQALQVLANDDLTGLVRHSFVVRGRKVG